MEADEMIKVKKKDLMVLFVWAGIHPKMSGNKKALEAVKKLQRKYLPIKNGCGAPGCVDGELLAFPGPYYCEECGGTGDPKKRRANER